MSSKLSSAAILVGSVLCLTVLVCSADTRSVLPRNKFGSVPKERGHSNERLIATSLETNIAFRVAFFQKIQMSPDRFAGAVAGGKTAQQEEDLWGGHVNGKTDLSILLKEGDPINVSIKMAPSGQVYLVSAARFVAAYETLYGEKVPPKVVRALKLFTGETPESAEILTMIDPDFDRAYRHLEIESHSRLFFSVIQKHDPQMAEELLVWLADHMANVFELCFAAGTVKNRKNWSKYLWYRNLLEGKHRDLDYLVEISRVKAVLKKKAAKDWVKPGPVNGGSTLHLPFGMVQYHLGKLEFRHSLKKIRQLLGE